MTYENVGQAALDYFPCRYGNSRLLFRGPRRRLQGDYVAFLGGTETYGKFIETPFPVLVEHDLGVRSVNLGCVNAGVDAYVADKCLLDICSKARVSVVQVMGAQNMSNRYYAVHARRNDRFLHPSRLLVELYDEIDFTDFHFTRHMLFALADASAAKFAMVRQELKDAWVARMRTLIEQIGGRVVLLWLARHEPPEGGSGDIADADPLFVDRDMMRALSDVVSGTVEIVARPDEIRDGIDEMVFGTLERPAAEEMAGPIVHGRAAQAVSQALRDLI